LGWRIQLFQVFWVEKKKVFGTQLKNLDLEVFEKKLGVSERFFLIFCQFNVEKNQPLIDCWLVSVVWIYFFVPKICVSEVATFGINHALIY
jgi:hypothetical protein